MNEIVSFIGLPLEVEGYGQISSLLGMRVFQKHYGQMVDSLARLKRCTEILEADRCWSVLEISQQIAEIVYEQLEGYGDGYAADAYSVALEAAEKILTEAFNDGNTN